MKTTPTKRKYMAQYEETPANIKKREERNKARYDLEQEGKVKKGDGKEVDHIKPLGAGGRNTPANQRVISAKENRGWRKGESGYKPKTVKGK
ncbi:MAG: HNH endonuclease [Patescibacteria group bacterium]|nr:HNH endonuclease [Patescibacteria group bacterium]